MVPEIMSGYSKPWTFQYFLLVGIPLMCTPSRYQILTWCLVFLVGQPHTIFLHDMWRALDFPKVGDNNTKYYHIKLLLLVCKSQCSLQSKSVHGCSCNLSDILLASSSCTYCAFHSVYSFGVKVCIIGIRHRSTPAGRRKYLKPSIVGGLDLCWENKRQWCRTLFNNMVNDTTDIAFWWCMLTSHCSFLKLGID